jgi:hypothetical protein
MEETTINMIDALQGQHAQLKRLLAQKVWISEAPKATLSEMKVQVVQIKALLAELEKNIQGQLQRDKNTECFSSANSNELGPVQGFETGGPVQQNVCQMAGFRSNL